MKLIEVGNSTIHQQAFLQLPIKLYKNDSNWIRPLDKDIEQVFDPKSNPAFLDGECVRWILVDQHNETIGRVAAFYSNKTKWQDNLQPTGGMGFFECIENAEAAKILFEACQQWLQDKGIEAMDGPINFGSRDKWWGLLIDGFTPPSYNINYNFPYYQHFFENYGFQCYFKQFTYLRQINDRNLHPGVLQRAERVSKNKGYIYQHIEINKLDKYLEDFRQIYNQAWVDQIAGASAMSPEQAQAIGRQLKPIIDEQLIWFVYYEKEPIAFFVMVPEINQLIKYVNGRLDWKGILKFLWYKWRGKCDKILGIAFGIVPKFQGRGIEAAIAIQFSRIAWNPKFKYKELELNWIGDFNPRMTKVVEMIGFQNYKTHITYRKLFNPDSPFQKPKILR
jgi:hypothetical protein